LENLGSDCESLHLHHDLATRESYQQEHVNDQPLELDLDLDHAHEKPQGLFAASLLFHQLVGRDWEQWGLVAGLAHWELVSDQRVPSQGPVAVLVLRPQAIVSEGLFLLMVPGLIPEPD
jgi:hypothetical protein